jgi:hypothetical protein
MTSRRRWLFTFLAGLAVLATVFVAGNVQYLFLTTYRVRNAGGLPLIAVQLSLESARGVRPVAQLQVPRGRSRSGWLRFTGEAMLRANVADSEAGTLSCSTYVEGGLYHVDVTLDAMGHLECRARVVAPLEIGWLNVMP